MQQAVEPKKVMLVDDSSFIRWGLSEDLRRLGYEPVEADSGLKALELLKSETGIGLILLDVQMKGWDGFDTLKAIRDDANSKALEAAGNEWVPVVFVTAQDTVEDRMKGFELGAAEFVLKNEVRASLRALTGRFLEPSPEYAELGILIADDSMIIRNLIKTSLKAYGVKFHEAATGAVALEFLKKHSDSVDLVITDLQMPEMNGDILCAKIRRELRLKDLPVIFLSSTENAQAVLNMFRAGGSDYIHKPFVREELTARLEVHMRRQLLARRLRENIDELRRLNALKDRFLAVCSHDLRSPLSGMMGLTELLLVDDRVGEEQREMLRHIEASGEYLLELINDILDLGRMQAAEQHIALEPVDLGEVLESCYVNMKHTAEPKKVHFERQLQSGVMVNGDRNALRRIFSNLTSNAIKFTPTEGRVDVIMQVNTSKKLVQVRVTDTGIGIPDDMMDKLFDEYSKLSRPGTAGEKGTGLGMAITRKLVEAHGGKISVESRAGEGATFTVVLPLLEVRRQQAESVVQQATAASLESVKDEAIVLDGLRVLVAEDNRVNQEWLKRVLGRWKCVFDLAENGREAAALFEDALDNAPYDVVLLDIEMPDIDGFQAARLMRIEEEDVMTDTGRECQAPIFALSARTDAESLEEIQRAGMNGLLAKPVKKAELRQILGQCRSTESQP